MSCVYLWLRPCGTPFYVGMSDGLERATNGDRNPHTNSVRDSLRREGHGLDVLIVPCETRDEALGLEVDLIALLGRVDLGTGPLTNMTCGGDGVFELSQDAERRRAEARLGKPCTDLTRDRIRSSMTPEVRDRIGSVHRGKKRSPEACERMRQAALRRSPPSAKARVAMMSAQYARRQHEKESVS